MSAGDDIVLTAPGDEPAAAWQLRPTADGLQLSF
jgi:hypothetical protein